MADPGQLIADMSGFGKFKKKPTFKRNRTRMRPPRISNVIKIKNIIHKLEKRRRELPQPRRRPFRKPRLTVEEAHQLRRGVLNPAQPFFSSPIVPWMQQGVTYPEKKQEQEQKLQAIQAQLQELAAERKQREQVNAEIEQLVRRLRENGPAAPEPAAPPAREPVQPDRINQDLEELGGTPARPPKGEKDMFSPDREAVPSPPSFDYRSEQKGEKPAHPQFSGSDLIDVPLEAGSIPPLSNLNDSFAVHEEPAPFVSELRQRRGRTPIENPGHMTLPEPIPAGGVPAASESKLNQSGLTDAEISRIAEMQTSGFGNKPSGNTDHMRYKPLSNFGLERIMAPYRQDGFVGVIANDEIPTLTKYVNRGSVMAWIQNLDNHDKPGSHWVAVWINMDQNKYGAPEVCYFDPLGNPPKEDTKAAIKKLLSHRFGLNCLPKWKVSLVPQQRSNSVTCGYISAQLLRRMFAGEPWSEATNYSITESEKEARRELGGMSGSGNGKYGYLYIPPDGYIE